MRDSRFFLSYFACFLLHLALSQANNFSRGYVFTAPKRLLAGETESGCLSFHNLEPPAHVQLKLVNPAGYQSEEEVLASTGADVKTGVETCLELVIPQTKYSVGKLRLSIKFDKHPDYVVENEKEVYIEHDSLITFAETDKPVYKPGQDVNIRILTLKHDLKPWKKPIPKVWIENPSEVRVAQWINVTTDQGMVQLKFPLSAEPSPGTWKIKVEKKKSHSQLVHTTTFEVKKYVLPRFQVTIKSPGYILADAENVTWNICAKYSYGKPVKGTLLLKSTPQTPSWRRKQNLPEIHYETELDSPDGCTEFKLSGAVLGLPHWKVAPNNIVLIANFTEAGTGVVETTISRTVVVHQALKLEFVPYTPKYFKLGLPYHGKLRVLHQDDTPAPNEKIQLCLKVRGKDEWLRVVVECRNFTSTADGFIDFIVPPQHKNIVLLSFLATGYDYPTKYYSPDKRWRVFMDQPSAYIDVNPWYSPSESYLAIARGYRPIVCGEKYSFNVMYTVPANNNSNESITFHYSINSKGDLLIFGHVNHRPSKDSVLNYSEFRNLLGAVETPANKTEHNFVVHRFPLSVKITPSMAPVSEMLLYYVRSDGETVATTYTIKVGNCFENKVKTAWHVDSQTPGLSTQFHIEAAPWSLCGVSVVDKSTLFLSGSKANLVDTEQAFDQLKRFHADSETAPIQGTWTHCKKATTPEVIPEEIDHLPSPAIEGPPAWEIRQRRRRSSLIHSGGVNYVDAMQAFDDFGVIVMSDLMLETRPCPQFQWFNFKPHIAFDMRRLTASGISAMPHLTEHDRSMAVPILGFPVAAAAMSPEMGYVDQLPDQTTTLRSYFPETWLWELVPTGKEGKSTIERTLPHTITDWVGHTVCVSPKHGLGVAPPTTLTAFQPFFLDYNLPYSVKRGEMLHMKVSLFNYMQHSLPVKIKLEDADGLDLHLSHPTASFCVKPRDSVVHEYILRPRVIGDINITVSAAIDPEFAESCGPETLVYTRDIIVKPILVLPEGFPVDTTKSAFICPKDFSDDSTIAWNLELPEDLVPDSARAYLTLIGDILGPAFENLDNLVRLPMGCGEQNMILFVPNIHVIAYLDANNKQNPDLRAKAIRNMEKGYQRELNYRHPDGSYSAFGPDSSQSGSMWLTAFVVKSLAQARSLIHVDERDLKLSVKWIVKRQLENGCFPVIGKVFHKDMKGGLQSEDSSSPALSAYVLISLLQSGVPLSATLINNALYCLEKGLESNSNSGNPYTAVLSTYALALLEHPNANTSMRSLIDRATRYHDLLWWEDKTKPSLGLSIEMTAYAVLSLVKLGGEGNMVEALKAIRWMSKQRNAEGGFTSTQDTIVGLEALTKYALAMSSNNTELSVLVSAGEVDQVYRMHNDNKMLLTSIKLPSLPTLVEIFAEGEGCVLVQSNLKYNVAKTTGSEAFDLSVNAESAALFDECSMQKITVCTRYKMVDEESNMALLEIAMISGYVPDRTSLHALLEDQATKIKRFEEDHGVVTIYFDKLTGDRTCISFLITRETLVDRVEDANVKLYDYYQQELTVTTSYNIAPTCRSADSDETPNPMPVEPKVPIVVKNTLGHEKTVENATEENIRSNKSSKPFHNKEPTSRNKVDVSMADKLEDRASFVEESLLNVDKLREKVAGKSYRNGNLTGSKSGREVLERKNNRLDAAFPGISENGNTLSGAKEEEIEDPGSGEIPDETDLGKNPSVEIERKEGEDSGFNGNPSFVVVDHELEIPDGIEGPPPVYVKPDFIPDDFPVEAAAGVADKNERPDAAPSAAGTPSGSKNDADGSKAENGTSGTVELSESDIAYIKEYCPHCEDAIPSNIKDIFCPAKTAIKIAVRRFRKVRLLIDVQPSRATKRIHSTLELALNPNCTCSPLDNPGTFALLLTLEGENYAALPDYSKRTLGPNDHVYGSISSRQITEIRSSCVSSSSRNSTSDAIPVPVGG